MKIAFTGPSDLGREQELLVVRRMEALAADLDTWRSGCAKGVDTIAAYQGILSGVLNVELYVPAAPHNTKLVEELEPRARIIHCPERAKLSDAYRARNEMMCLHADLLVGFVKSPAFYRSGEWMTINIARKFGVETDVHVI
jgi:hypothetical protein